jgi:penicillin-binding protein 2
MVFEKADKPHGAKNTDTSFNYWRNNVAKFGFGRESLGLDMPSEGRGNLPKASYYDKFTTRAVGVQVQ